MKQHHTRSGFSGGVVRGPQLSSIRCREVHGARCGRSACQASSCRQNESQEKSNSSHAGILDGVLNLKAGQIRSEARRVGKEWRYRWGREREKKKEKEGKYENG